MNAAKVEGALLIGQLSHAGRQTATNITLHPVGPSDLQLKDRYVRHGPLLLTSLTLVALASLLESPEHLLKKTSKTLCIDSDMLLRCCILQALMEYNSTVHMGICSLNSCLLSSILVLISMVEV